MHKAMYVLAFTKIVTMCAHVNGDGNDNAKADYLLKRPINRLLNGLKCKCIEPNLT